MIKDQNDFSLVISDRGNALKADLDDPTNTNVKSVGTDNLNVAGNMGQQITTNDPISNIIGGFMGIFKGLFDTIGGIL